MVKDYIDIDKYIDESVKIKFKDKVLDVKEPSARLTKELINLEKSITNENALDIQEETVRLILNNNKNGIELTTEDIKEIPYKVQKIILREIKTMRERVEPDQD